MFDIIQRKFGIKKHHFYLHGKEVKIKLEGGMDLGQGDEFLSSLSSYIPQTFPVWSNADDLIQDRPVSNKPKKKILKQLKSNAKSKMFEIEGAIQQLSHTIQSTSPASDDVRYLLNNLSEWMNSFMQNQDNVKGWLTCQFKNMKGLVLKGTLKLSR